MRCRRSDLRGENGAAAIYRQTKSWSDALIRNFRMRVRVQISEYMDRTVREDIMKRVLTASVVAGTLAIATIVTPTSAQAQWGRRGLGWGLGGLALGLFIGAALSRPAYAYGYGYPAYSYGYGPAYGYASSGYGAGPEGYASYGYGYPAYSYASYGYPGYGYGGGYYRPVYRSAYYGGYRPAYRPAVYGGYRVARRVAIHRARWR
jgi:hypothetical protein